MRMSASYVGLVRRVGVGFKSQASKQTLEAYNQIRQYPTTAEATSLPNESKIDT